MHLADNFIQSDLYSGYTLFCQYVCSLGIEPITFCVANAIQLDTLSVLCSLWEWNPIIIGKFWLNQTFILPNFYYVFLFLVPNLYSSLV